VLDRCEQRRLPSRPPRGARCRQLLQGALEPLEALHLPLDAPDLETRHALHGAGRSTGRKPQRQQLSDLLQGESEAMRALDEADAP
jgi:hypothetical protein